MPRNLYDPVSMYDVENPDAPEPVGGYNVSRPWMNGMRKAAPRVDAQERAAAMRRLGGGDEGEEIDLTPANLMDSSGLSATQEWALSSKYSPQELQKLRDEVAADPQAFGANRFGTATAEFGGKKYKMNSFSSPSTKRAANWVEHERNVMREDKERKASAEKNAVELAKANVPVEAAKVAAGADEKRLLAEKARWEAQDKRAADDLARRIKLEDEQLALRKEVDTARATGAARDIREGQSEKQRRVAEKLSRIGREELAGLEFNPDEQRAVMARLGGADPDLAGLAEEQYLRRPNADMAMREYDGQIQSVARFLKDNYMYVSDDDKRKLNIDVKALMERAQRDLPAAQFARFKDKVRETLSGAIDETDGFFGYFGPTSARRTALRSALGY